jgi:hypothetical protein
MLAGRVVQGEAVPLELGLLYTEQAEVQDVSQGEAHGVSQGEVPVSTWVLGEAVPQQMGLSHTER